MPIPDLETELSCYCAYQQLLMSFLEIPDLKRNRSWDRRMPVVQEVCHNVDKCEPVLTVA